MLHHSLHARLYTFLPLSLFEESAPMRERESEANCYDALLKALLHTIYILIGVFGCILNIQSQSDSLGLYIEEMQVPPCRV